MADYASDEKVLAQRPIYPIHPGEVLTEQIDLLKMTGAELARTLQVPAIRVYQILGGKCAMTPEIALRLENWLGVEAEFWLNLQKRYELQIRLSDKATAVQ